MFDLVGPHYTLRRSGVFCHMTNGRVVKALGVVALNEADISFLGIVSQKFALFGNLSVVRTS